MVIIQFVKLSFLPFALTIFIGAFLLFQVQPIISKYILPWFGGTSAVWTTAMLFFQTVLLLGYAYILFIAKLSLKKQIVLHALVVVGIVSLILSLFTFWKAPILPDISLKLNDNISPIFQVLSILSIGVGLPYFLLSTTSVLLQRWFGVIQADKSPYPLYALSNVASLLALLSYPVFIEPFFPLQRQGFGWAIGFVLYGIFLLVCCGQTWFGHTQKKDIAVQKHVVIEKKVALLWLLLSAISTLMLLAITNIQTQSIAPVPFLWILPLSLYLLSFILCFSGERWYWRNLYAYIFLVTMPLVLVFSVVQAPSVLSGIIIYSLALFSCCMICHGELYRLRPHPKRLDTFYVLIALGSVMSGIFVGIVAPLLFNGFWEIYIGFYLSFLLAVIVLTRYKNSFAYRLRHVFFTSDKELYLCMGIGYPTILIALSFVLPLVSGYSSIKHWRNFYGTVTVKEKGSGQAKVIQMQHGNIIHGTQSASGSQRFEPTAYFGKKSGVGLALSAYGAKYKNIHVGIIGLGVGTLAAYGRAGDLFRFYEINPQVVTVAHNNFTYVKDSPAKIDIVLGDGRLSLEKEVKEKSDKFDIVVLDAFSDDAIPVHLLTQEAFALYLARLTMPNGVIAVNISNNYINLRPLLVQVAKHFGLHYAVIRSKAEGNTLLAEWILLTKNKEILDAPEIIRAKEKKQYKTVSLWTDDYSNLFQLLK